MYKLQQIIDMVYNILWMFELYHEACDKWDYKDKYNKGCMNFNLLFENNQNNINLHASHEGEYHGANISI